MALREAVGAPGAIYWLTLGMLVGAVLGQGGCSRQQTLPSPALAQELAEDPQRLSALQSACRRRDTAVSEAQCAAVSEAARLRFLRASPSPYAAPGSTSAQAAQGVAP
ncbi:hypothetical protein SAMN05880557_11764 [Pseudacidovorax sp. RU35E]|nr:hypothetical protein SAMN05880557_11764 [Pseudacidovorax sp. RU35E]